MSDFFDFINGPIPREAFDPETPGPDSVPENARYQLVVDGVVVSSWPTFEKAVGDNYRLKTHGIIRDARPDLPPKWH